MAIPKKTSVLAVASTCVLGLAAGLHAPEADAYNTRTRQFRPTGLCEAPLPVFDVHLRKAPQRVDNIGTETIFVNCAVPTDPVGDIGSAWLEVHYFASAAATGQVSCTLVTGTADAPVYHALSRRVSPDSNSWFTWHAIDKGGPEGLLAVQCVLPPGVQLTRLVSKETDAGGDI
jgi:hypothetical protein